MTQRPIPFLFLRGGTSRGPCFLRSELPEDRDQLSRVKVSEVGAGNKRTVDGLGGAVEVTTKVALLSRSDDPAADMDDFFAQVGVEKPRRRNTSPPTNIRWLGESTLYRSASRSVQPWSGDPPCLWGCKGGLR